MSAKNNPEGKPNFETNEPPTFYDTVKSNLNMNLEKLISHVVSRYILLKDIESLTQTKRTKMIYSKIPEELHWSSEEYINNDIASHFILALIMCKNEGEARWFIKQESSLYKARLEQNKRYDMFKILSALGLKLNLFDKNKDKDVDINNIRFKRKDLNEEKIYFCRFEDAINLIASKDYYLYKGNIYILETDLPLLFKLVFEQKQEKVMAKIRANSESIKRDRRIKEILLSFEREKEILNNQEAAKMAKEIPSDEKLRTMHDVDIVSERCFPLCMNLIERHINQYSHLMHFGRLQYTLFLKGAGLPVEETLKFYQKKYEKKKSLAAASTEIIIEGGNHAGFGSYGAQSGDGEASITPAEQVNRTADVILEFIAGTP